MSGHTDYAQNRINDAIWRGQVLAAPTTYYFGLICATLRAGAPIFCLPWCDDLFS
jgi:hypothetical protein